MSSQSSGNWLCETCWNSPKEDEIGSPIICLGCGDHRYWKYDVSIGKYVCKCGRPLEHEEIENELNKGYDNHIREKEQKGGKLYDGSEV